MTAITSASGQRKAVPRDRHPSSRTNARRATTRSTTRCTRSRTSSSSAGATAAFVFPATVAFLSWYLLYVVMSNWAHDFMSKQLWGNINVALVFGLLQFVTTFLLAWIYSRYSTNRLDPLARKLDEQYIAELEGRR